MTTRPSTVRFRRYPLRRRTCRCFCEFFVFMILFLLCDLRFVSSFLLAGLGLLLFELLIFKSY